jgi:hypothetical protein
MLQNFEDLENAFSSKAALWLFIRKDLIQFYRWDEPQVTTEQTALMLIILAAVLMGLRAFTSYHYFLGAGTDCYGFVIGCIAGCMGKRRQTRP